ncbi:adenylate/guanylate cyclase domain-containing protein [Roseibium aquae]|nr:adenylate/guanylate cyclase domain-containing protein [Roseibium aquae]
MTLRFKTLLLVSATLILSAAALFYFVSEITLGSYRQLENDNANKDLQRLEKVFHADLERLFSLLEDFASWDDTYRFIETDNPEFIRSNFAADTFSAPEIEFVLIVDSLGNALHTSSYGLEPQLAKAIIAGLENRLGTSGDLLEDYPEEYGLVTLRRETLLIAMAPVLKSDDSGPPRGVMLAGKVLDTKMLDQLRLRTQLDLNFQNLMVNPNVPGVKPHLTAFLDENPLPSFDNPPHLMVADNPQSLLGYILMPGILGDPLLLWAVEIPRDIYSRGIQSLRVLLVVMAAIGAILICCILFLLERLVLRRISRLGKTVAEIGEKDDLTVRVRSEGTDELGQLGRTLNWMLDQLQVSRKKALEEHDRAENLLLNILPSSIAEQLKNTNKPIADSHNEVSVLFADLAGFTALSATMAPTDLLAMLNTIFSRFDELTQTLGLEKIKTIGDAYMVASGLPDPRDDHAQACAEMAIGMLKVMDEFSSDFEQRLQIRIGINSGTVVAGVIGKKKFIYDLWGDTVNIASRMESTGVVGMIQVTEATYERLKNSYDLEKRGEIDVKGCGPMTTYVLEGRKN